MDLGCDLASRRLRHAGSDTWDLVLGTSETAWNVVLEEGEAAVACTLTMIVSGATPGAVEVVMEREAGGVVAQWENKALWQPHMTAQMRLVYHDPTCTALRWNPYPCLRPTEAGPCGVNAYRNMPYWVWHVPAITWQSSVHHTGPGSEPGDVTYILLGTMPAFDLYCESRLTSDDDDVPAFAKRCGGSCYYWGEIQVQADLSYEWSSGHVARVTSYRMGATFCANPGGVEVFTYMRDIVTSVDDASGPSLPNVASPLDTLSPPTNFVRNYSVTSLPYGSIATYSNVNPDSSSDVPTGRFELDEVNPSHPRIEVTAANNQESIDSLGCACDCQEMTGDKTFTLEGLTGDAADYNGTFTIPKGGTEGNECEGCCWGGGADISLSWADGVWALSLGAASYTVEAGACDATLTLEKVSGSADFPDEVVIT